MNRRDLLIGGTCIAALGMSEALRPRTVVTLKGRGKLADVLPRIMPRWVSREGGDIVIPKTPDSLTSKLYSDMVARVYSPSHGELIPPVMLLAAYGENQSDVLQLHRPESCYPAVGFQITHRRLVDIPLSRNALIPGVELTAVSGDRVEDIVYWTRLGEYLPQTSQEQRSDRLLMSLHGIIGDGILVRCSSTRVGTEANFGTLFGFIAELLDRIPPIDRRMMVGTTVDRQLGSSVNVRL